MKLKLFMHTRKAVKAGHPGDRVFLAVDLVNNKYHRNKYIAWKCRLQPDGLEHPAFYNPGTNVRVLLPLTTKGIEQGNIPEIAKNGSEPTAVFREDSFYEKVSIAELKKRAADLREFVLSYQAEERD